MLPTFAFVRLATSVVTHMYSSFSHASHSIVVPTTWTAISDGSGPWTPSHILSQTIPNLTPSSHKGSSGRIGILGGSERYTGAPYYTAMASLRSGADLAYVFCAEEATIPIKSYSPELMVQGVYSARVWDAMVQQIGPQNTSLLENHIRVLPDEAEVLIQAMVEKVIASFDRLHCLVIGPGLGRCPLVFQATSRVIQEAKKRGIPLILDADALYLVSLQQFHHLISDKSDDESGDIVLTPNSIEYKRILDTLGSGSEENLKQKLKGVVIVRKGFHDRIESISASDEIRPEPIQLMVCEELGGLKRSGGLGDILSGIMGTFIAWNKILSSHHETSKRNSEGNATLLAKELVLPCWMACCVTKRATNKAYEKKKRSMTAPDVLDMIGDVMIEMESVTAPS